MSNREHQRRNTDNDVRVDPVAPLYWGYNQGLPRTGGPVEGWFPAWSAAWGTRAHLLRTVTNGRTRDIGYTLVAERSSTIGPADEVTRLIQALDGGGHDLWLTQAHQAMTDGRLRPGSLDEVTLYDGSIDDLNVTIKASHEGWEGWLYVVAYTTPEPEPHIDDQ